MVVRQRYVEIRKREDGRHQPIQFFKFCLNPLERRLVFQNPQDSLSGPWALLKVAFSTVEARPCLSKCQLGRLQGVLCLLCRRTAIAASLQLVAAGRIESSSSSPGRDWTFSRCCCSKVIWFRTRRETLGESGTSLQKLATPIVSLASSSMICATDAMPPTEPRTISAMRAD